MADRSVARRVQWPAWWVAAAAIVGLSRAYHPSWPLVSPLSAVWGVALVAFFVALVVPSLRGR